MLAEDADVLGFVELDAAVDINAQLPNDDADQQGSGDATQNETADLDLADEIAERNGQKKGEQRLCRK